MYANKIIESLRGWELKQDNRSKEYAKAHKLVIMNLEQHAVFFSLGYIDKQKQESVFNINKNQGLFRYDPEAYRLPFTTICLLFSSEESARSHAVLCVEGFDERNNDERFLNIAVIVEYQEGWALSPIIYILKTGSIDFDGKICPSWLIDGLTQQEKNDYIGQYELSILDKFLRLLSCKNITAENNYPPVAINKKRIKKGKLPLFSYKTLVIKPTGKKQESVPKNLWDNRVHLCRGHFKTYTEKNPLFGRITGRYWWQPCVRGNKEKGVVMKDYVVETVQ